LQLPDVSIIKQFSEHHI